MRKVGVDLDWVFYVIGTPHGNCLLDGFVVLQREEARFIKIKHLLVKGNPLLRIKERKKVQK